MRSWHSAVLSGRSRVDDGLFIVSLEVPDEVTGAFSRPGQFQRVRQPGSAESYFAIASPPGARRFDYLVREGTGVSAVLATAPLGERLEVTEPEGKGFPLDSARGHDLLLVATGTGLGPLRSVLGVVGQRRDDFGRVTLLQGQRSPAQRPWLDELEGLPRVEVQTIVNDAAPGWTGPVGLVQALLPATLPPSTIAFLVGQPEMAADVTARLERLGVPRGQVFLNV